MLLLLFHSIMVVHKILVLRVQVRLLLEQLLVVMTITDVKHITIKTPQVGIVYVLACGFCVSTDYGCRHLASTIKPYNILDNARK